LGKLYNQESVFYFTVQFDNTK